jgi:hypothetical protein
MRSPLKREHQHGWTLMDPSNYQGPIFICLRCGTKRLVQEPPPRDHDERILQHSFDDNLKLRR